MSLALLLLSLLLVFFCMQHRWNWCCEVYQLFCTGLIWIFTQTSHKCYTADPHLHGHKGESWSEPSPALGANSMQKCRDGKGKQAGERGVTVGLSRNIWCSWFLFYCQYHSSWMGQYQDKLKEWGALWVESLSKSNFACLKYSAAFVEVSPTFAYI